MSTKPAAVALAFLLAVPCGGSLAGEPVPCARLLTPAEVQEAAGPGWTSLGQEEAGPGTSECTWLREDGPNPRAIAVTFWEKAAMKSSLPEHFEAQAARAEKAHGNPRETLEGVGEKAVLVPGKKPGAMAVLVIRTAKGVAYVETDYLERAQLLRLARAVAGP